MNGGERLAAVMAAHGVPGALLPLVIALELGGGALVVAGLWTRAAALALAQAERRELLLDADYQGTSSEWGNRYAARFGIETRSQVQPIVHTEVQRFEGQFDWVVVDGPPSLSEMTESILRACDVVIIPVRPAPPDVWAIPWLAAIIRKVQQGGERPRARVVFNQHAGEPLGPLREELGPWRLPVHPVALFQATTLFGDWSVQMTSRENVPDDPEVRRQLV